MKKSHTITFLTLFGVLLVMIALDLLIGSVHIPMKDVFDILGGGLSTNPGWETIVLEFRVPKAVTAILAGSGLGISGLLMQTIFRNPLAGPFVLGISSGASLGVALLILAGSAFGIAITQLTLLGSWTTVMAAIAGSSLVMLLIVVVSVSIRDGMTLLIIGLMVGSLSGALVSVLQYFSEAREIQSFLIWTFGNLGGVHGSELVILIITVLIGLMWSWWFSKPLNALLLGESYAKSMGVNIRQTRLLVIIITSILAGGITAFCGPLAFIGIAIPHLARIVFKTANHQVLIPGCILLGAVVMTVCDLVSQIPGSSRTLPINAITSLLGAPAVIAILIKNRNLSKSFT
jgi:iron complex transport system permease protein